MVRRPRTLSKFGLSDATGLIPLFLFSKRLRVLQLTPVKIPRCLGTVNPHTRFAVLLRFL